MGRMDRGIMLAVPIAALVLALTGCGSDDADTTPDGAVVDTLIDASPETVEDMATGADTPTEDLLDGSDDEVADATAPADVLVDLSDGALPPDTIDDIALAPDTTGDVADQLGELPLPEVLGDTALDTILDALPEEVTTTPAIDLMPYVGWAGTISMIERSSGLPSSEVSVRLTDQPPVSHHGIIHEVGQCLYLLAMQNVDCTPPCDTMVEYCGPDQACHPFPSRISAGTIAFQGLAEPVSAVPNDTAWYTTEPSSLPADLFTADSTIQVSAEGGADIEAFQEELGGVGPLAPLFDVPVELVDGEDEVFAWEVQGDGSTVELAIQTGWHGAPPVAVIWCVAPDEAGSIVVDEELVGMFPPAGGIGLFPHVSWIRRVERALVDTTAGTIEISTQSLLTFSISH